MIRIWSKCSGMLKWWYAPSRYCILVGGITADLYGTLGFNHRSVKAIAWQSVYVFSFVSLRPSFSTFFSFFFFFCIISIHTEEGDKLFREEILWLWITVHSRHIILLPFLFSCILHYRITIHFSIIVTRRAKTIRVLPRYREDLLAIILPAHSRVTSI